MNPPILTLLLTSVKKFAHVVIRDYGEIGSLLVNKENAKKFALASSLKFQQSVFDDLKLFKPAYSFEFNDFPNILNQDKSNTFVINGILGLENFIRGIPYFAISLNLKRDGKVFAGVLYNPITSDTFYAQHNEGAYHNNKRLRYVPSNFKNSEKLTATDHVTDGLICYNNCAALDVAFFLANKIDATNFIKEYKDNELAFLLLLAIESGAMLNYSTKENLITNIVNG